MNSQTTSYEEDSEEDDTQASIQYAGPDSWPDSIVLKEIYSNLDNDEQIDTKFIYPDVFKHMRQPTLVPKALRRIFPSVLTFLSYFSHIELASRSSISRDWRCYALPEEDYVREAKKRFILFAPIHCTRAMFFLLRSGNCIAVRGDAEYFSPSPAFLCCSMTQKTSQCQESDRGESCRM
jgi:hypothetical protein